MEEMTKTVDSLPLGKNMIGTREIVKAIKAGKIKSVIAARNCPKNLLDEVAKCGTEVVIFTGDQQELGTKLGKPFPVAMVGYE